MIQIHFPIQPDVYEIQVREMFVSWFFKQKSLHNQAAMGNAPAACCKCEEDGWIHVGHVGREILVSVVSIARASVCVCGFSSNEDEAFTIIYMIYMRMNHGTCVFRFHNSYGLTAWNDMMLEILKEWTGLWVFVIDWSHSELVGFNPSSRDPLPNKKQQGSGK